MAQLKRDRDDLAMNMATIESGAATCMISLNTTYGVDDDITGFHSKKNTLTRLLMNFPREVKNRLAIFAALEKQYNLFQMIADLKQAEDEEAARQAANKKQDDLPAWAKKSGADNADASGEDDPPSFVSRTSEGNGPEVEEEDEFGTQEDDYAIKAITFDTVEVTKDGKIFTRLKSSDAATVIIRMRGSDHIIDGSEAVNLLIEKGYLYHVAGVGLVTTSRYAAFSDETGSPGGKITKKKKKSVSDLYKSKSGWQDGIKNKSEKMDNTTKQTFGGAVMKKEDE